MLGKLAMGVSPDDRSSLPAAAGRHQLPVVVLDNCWL
jgi:hypothetical protein